MEKLIDMHCHVLYGVDDGAKTLEMSVNMVRIAAKEGIGTMILTPHFHPGKGTQNVNKWKEHMDKLSQAVAAEGIDMKFYLGSELFYTHDVPDAIEEGRAISMVESDYVLVEFRPETEYKYIRSAIYDITVMGKTPIIAHIERYMCIYNKIERVEELIDIGALIQINASSVVGEMGFMMKQYIKKLLKRNLVDFIGTDAHRDTNRAPLMADCFKYISKRFGEDYAVLLMRDNAQKIIMNEEI